MRFCVCALLDTESVMGSSAEMEITMKILIKGAGDLATGIGYRLAKAGYEILMTEIEVPTTVRRTVAFSRAVYKGETAVEDLIAVRIRKPEEIYLVQKEGKIPVIVDERAEIAKFYKPDIVVDGIIAKENMGTSIDEAPFVIGVGPGFTAGEDCHAVVETKRGHYLGRVIWEGSAIANTGVPGEIGGFSTERIIRASADGVFEPIAHIGETVKEGQIVALCGGEPVHVMMSGIVRGLLQSGVKVTKGMKAGDVDARCIEKYCHTISDKARSIGGGVLEAAVYYEHKAKERKGIL